MPGVDNRAIWDKGIGPAAETIFSSSAPATMSGTPTNYNTGAWSQDQTVQTPTTTTTQQTPTATKSPSTPSYSTPQQSSQPQQKKAPTAYYENLKRYQLEVQQIQQQISMANAAGGKFNGLNVSQLQQKLQDKMRYLQQWQAAVSKLEGV